MLGNVVEDDGGMHDGGRKVRNVQDVLRNLSVDNDACARESFDIDAYNDPRNQLQYQSQPELDHELLEANVQPFSETASRGNLPL